MVCSDSDLTEVPLSLDMDGKTKRGKLWFENMHVYIVYLGRIP